MEAVRPYEMSVTSTGLYGVTSHNMIFFRVIAVTSSNPTFLSCLLCELRVTKNKRMGADKSLLLLFPIFLFAAQPKEYFLNGLKKLEQRSHKCVELRGEYVESIHFSVP
jgi:hypothetical protein